MMRYASFNPYWNVPSDLVQRRIAPKVLDGATLKGMRYEALSDWTANASVLDPANIDWSAIAQGRENVRVRQLPGRNNAMGRMKFMFPNDLGIYLHDRSEEHTSELQSLMRISYAVFCLKKKTKSKYKTQTTKK